MLPIKPSFADASFFLAPLIELETARVLGFGFTEVVLLFWFAFWVEFFKFSLNDFFFELACLPRRREIRSFGFGAGSSNPFPSPRSRSLLGGSGVISSDVIDGLDTLDTSDMEVTDSAFARGAEPSSSGDEVLFTIPVSPIKLKSRSIGESCKLSSEDWEDLSSAKKVITLLIPYLSHHLGPVLQLERCSRGGGAKFLGWSSFHQVLCWSPPKKVIAPIWSAFFWVLHWFPKKSTILKLPQRKRKFAWACWAVWGGANFSFRGRWPLLPPPYFRPCLGQETVKRFSMFLESNRHLPTRPPHKIEASHCLFKYWT